MTGRESIQARMRAAVWPARMRAAAWWIAPLLPLFLLYRQSLRIWFREDDFPLLEFVRRMGNSHEFLAMMFRPYAQGTIRPWSERLPFFLSRALFDTDCVPFRIMVLLTTAADILLITWIVRRITGSRIAGLAAPLFWIAGASLVSPMTWNSSYNQVQSPLFLLGALACFVRYGETGARRYWWLQCAIFVAGFGSLENEVVYPAIAVAWSLFAVPAVRRKSMLLSAIPLFGISALYTLIHFKVVSTPAASIYAIHVDWRMVTTFLEYWRWAFLSPGWADHGFPRPAGSCILVASMASLVLFAGWQLRQRRTEVLFCLAWFLLTLAPMLPLPDRHSEYYLVVPSIGLSMLSGWGVALASKCSPLRRAALLVPVLGWFGGMLPVVRASTRLYVAESRMSRGLVLGVQAARASHPGKAIVLAGIDSDLYRIGIAEFGFRAVGVEDVYLTPGSEPAIGLNSNDDLLERMTLDPAVAFRAVTNDKAVVYAFAGDHLRNITAIYVLAHEADAGAVPRRLAIGSMLYSPWLGSEWMGAKDDVRWMPATATVRIGEPRVPGEHLKLSGFCLEAQLRHGPVHITVRANGLLLGDSAVVLPDTRFHRSFGLPPALIGNSLMNVEIGIDPVRSEAGQAFGARFDFIAVEP